MYFVGLFDESGFIHSFVSQDLIVNDRNHTLKFLATKGNVLVYVTEKPKDLKIVLSWVQMVCSTNIYQVPPRYWILL